MADELPVKIFIVDDHQMMIDGISSLLKANRQFEVCGSALSGEEAIRELELETPDIVISDISMPGMSGLDLSRLIAKLHPSVKILALTMYNDREIINEIMATGAKGYILKNTGKKELINALSAVARGGTYYSAAVVDTLVSGGSTGTGNRPDIKSDNNELTGREKEVVRLIVKEYSSQEIAEELYISVRTVETHRKNIISKTGTKNIVALVKYAFEHNLVDG